MSEPGPGHIADCGIDTLNIKLEPFHEYGCNGLYLI
jgi:hypothetical protein